MTSSQTIAASQSLASQGGTLTVRTGDAAGTSLVIGNEAKLLGRNSGCHLVLPDRRVSAIHAEVVATDRGVLLRDLGSLNGCLIGGARVRECLLAERLSLWVGETELEFEPSAPTNVDLPSNDSFGGMYGSSPLMRELFARLEKVAVTDLTVLVLGETGTGKEVAAQAIHRSSRRSAGPFVVIDCGAIAPTLAEAILFGHERGAYTDAHAARVSPFVEAQGGTVFLDEIGEIPVQTQPKLLRALAERRVKPVGGTRYLDFDVRVIAATRRELTQAVNEGSFRSDLFFRLAQLTVKLPPLRERREDMPGLVRQLLQELDAQDAWARVPTSCLQRLVRYDWPGNVRELRNAVAVALALAQESGPVDIAAHIGAATRTSRGSSVVADFREARRTTIDRFEHDYFEQLSRDCEGNISEMARRSGLERSHIRRYLKKCGIGS